MMLVADLDIEYTAEQLVGIYSLPQIYIKSITPSLLR
jgi:hypothetical protein